MHDLPKQQCINCPEVQYSTTHNINITHIHNSYYCTTGQIYSAIWEGDMVFYIYRRYLYAAHMLIICYYTLIIGQPHSIYTACMLLVQFRDAAKLIHIDHNCNMLRGCYLYASLSLLYVWFRYCTFHKVNFLHVVIVFIYCVPSF